MYLPSGLSKFCESVRLPASASASLPHKKLNSKKNSRAVVGLGYYSANEMAHPAILSLQCGASRAARFHDLHDKQRVARGCISFLCGGQWAQVQNLWGSPARVGVVHVGCHGPEPRGRVSVSPQRDGLGPKHAIREGDH